MNQPGKRPRIVVGVDGSPPSILAMRWAGALVSVLEAEIRAVTPWEFQILHGSLTPAVPNPDHVARSACSEAVGKAFGTALPAALERVIRQGPATKVLIDESRRGRRPAHRRRQCRGCRTSKVLGTGRTRYRTAICTRGTARVQPGPRPPDIRNRA
jgi:hypothetical protein